MFEKVQVFLFFVALKSPKCCVLQAKIKFVMKSTIFFFLWKVSGWGGAIPELFSQAGSPVSEPGSQPFIAPQLICRQLVHHTS